MQTPLNPGVPVFCVGGFWFPGSSHFGGVLTALPDSNLLVLRTAPGHPLNLQPGDIILGYEGVRWKDLVPELLEAEIPITGAIVGAASARNDDFLICAGLNWHLFDTIDVVKHTTGETVHLSVAPLVTTPRPRLDCTEQLPVRGVPMPDYMACGGTGYPVAG